MKGKLKDLMKRHKKWKAIKGISRLSVKKRRNRPS